MALVEIEDMGFSYPGADAPALVDVNLALERGEFVVLCGRSGCGKTTLLRHLKTSLTPAGNRSGSIRFAGKALADVPLNEQAQAIGFVLQNPETQIVTDKVWHELAFGLESLAVPPEVIRLRVAEMASFFGIQEWYHRRVTELSGGQKQLLNLAAVMALQPKLLILDEPTSQLDPIAASEFLAAVRKVNGELGVTVLLSEHRLEEALPLCDRVLVMSEGQLVGIGKPAEVGRELAALDDPMLVAMPTPMQAALAVQGASGTLAVPVSVREGRSWLEGYCGIKDTENDGPHNPDDLHNPDTTDSPGGPATPHTPGTPGTPHTPDTPHTPSSPHAPNARRPRGKEPVITAHDVWFRYAKDDADVLRGMELAVYPGELLAIVGGNGTGKTTALGTLSGALKPYRGRIRVAGLDPVKAGMDKVAARGLTVLPQDPQTLFLHNTIIEDLTDALPRGTTKEKGDERLAWVIEATEIAEIATHHPYDVSGGEQQRAALAMALLSEPDLLLMDEPTKGMDAFYKMKFAGILDRLREGGLTVVMVSHDVEFCAAYATRCALFFDGGVVTEGSPQRFFSGNSFYTTAANRMGRDILPSVVTTAELIAVLTGTPASGAGDTSNASSTNRAGGVS